MVSRSSGGIKSVWQLIMLHVEITWVRTILFLLFCRSINGKVYLLLWNTGSQCRITTVSWVFQSIHYRAPLRHKHLSESLYLALVLCTVSSCCFSIDMILYMCLYLFGKWQFWLTNICLSALERTFLAYLRTSLALSMLGVSVAQLLYVTHQILEDFSYYSNTYSADCNIPPSQITW